MPQEKVDSAFTTNLTNIREELDTGQRLTGSQVSFVYVLGFLSSLSFDLQSYSGYPNLTKQDVVRFTNWYTAHRSQIKWSKVQQGLTLIETPTTKDINVELEALKIK